MQVVPFQALSAGYKGPRVPPLTTICNISFRHTHGTEDGRVSKRNEWNSTGSACANALRPRHCIVRMKLKLLMRGFSPASGIAGDSECLSMAKWPSQSTSGFLLRSICSCISALEQKRHLAIACLFFLSPQTAFEKLASTLAVALRVPLELFIRSAGISGCPNGARCSFEKEGWVECCRLNASCWTKVPPQDTPPLTKFTIINTIYWLT